MKKFNILKKLLSVTILISLAACGSSSGSSTNSSSNGPGNIPEQYNDTVTITQTTTFPTVNGATGQVYYLAAHNNTPNKITLESFRHSGADGVFDAGQCSILQPNDLCLISVKPDKQNGRETVDLSFKNSAGKSYAISQVVAFSDVAANNGFHYAANSLNLVGKPNGKIFVSIPFVPDENFKSINVKSSITPVYQGTPICAGNKYTKGNACTVILGFKTPTNGDLSSSKGLFSLLHSSSNKSDIQTSKITLEGITTDGRSLKSLTSVSISSNNIANLITNAVNVPVTTNQTPASFDILNSGLVDATNVVISAESNAISVTSNCGSTISKDSPSNHCTGQITTNTFSIGQTAVNITYNNGVETKTNSFAVVYYPEKLSPTDAGLSIITSGDFNSVYNSESRTRMLTVTNIGTVPIKNINLTAQSKLPVDFSYTTQNVTGNICSLSGQTTLQSNGDSCVIGLNYNPSGAIVSGTFKVAAQGTTDTVGSVAATSQNIPYSVLSSSAPFTLNGVSALNFDTPGIKADNNSTSQQMITLTNNLVRDLQFDITSLPAGLSIICPSCGGIDPSQQKVTTPSGQAFQLTFKFGPVNTDINSSGSLSINAYEMNGTPVTISPSSYPISYYLVANRAALISAVLSEVPSATPDPIFQYTHMATTGIYSFVGNTASTVNGYLKLKYTLTNTGLLDATNVQLGINQLPLGFFIDNASQLGDKCDLVNGTTLLANSGNSCTVIISFIDQNIFKYFGTDQGFARILSPLTVSYIDSNYGVSSTQSRTDVPGTDMFIITAQSWLGISVQSQAIGNGQIKVTFVVSSVAAAASKAVLPTNPIPLGQGFTEVSRTGSCSQMDDQTNNTCTIIYNVDQSLPVTTYRYAVDISALASNNFPAYRLFIPIDLNSMVWN